MKKKEPRALIAIRVSVEEKEIIKKNAKEFGNGNVSEWIRSQALLYIHGAKKKTG